MTPLRQRMMEDLQIRNYSPSTVRSFVRSVADFAKHFKRSPDKKGRQVTTAEYVKVLVEIQTYLAPKMQATALTGAEGGPVAVAAMDVTQLMANPELARAAQLLALGMAQQPQAQLSLPEDEGHTFLYEDTERP